MTSVSIIIPTRNEEKTIADIITSVRPYGTPIVIDGHSNDATRTVAKIFDAKVYLDSGKGKGSGIQKGIEISESNITVFIDSDGSHIAEDIPALIAPIINNEADMCIGSRMTGGSMELHGDLPKFFRITMSMAITLIINYRFGVRLTDSQNGFRAFRTSVAKSLNLKENSFATETESLIRCLKLGYRVTEIPSKELKRKYGESNINLWKMWYRYVACVLRNII